MIGDNYNRLFINQEETESHITTYLTSENVDNREGTNNNKRDDLLKRIKAKLEEAKGSRNTGNLKTSSEYFAEAMDLGEELRDLKQGIYWVRERNNSDGTKTLIRDAREMNQDVKNFNTKESYLIQGINIVSAVMKVADNGGIEDSIGMSGEDSKSKLSQTLHRILDKLIGDIDNLGKEDINIKEFDVAVRRVAIEHGISKKFFDKHINSALNFSALDKQQYHVATITNTQDNKVIAIECDNMMLGLTGWQENQYTAISEVDIGKKVSVGKVDIDWYNNLTPFDKAMVREHAEEISKGNKCLPTQLRKHLIGMRNAHSKSTYVFGGGSNKLELVNRVMHSGTLSYHGKGDKQKVANENVKQFKSFLGKGVNGHVCVLTSPSNPKEKPSNDQIREASTESSISYSTTPFNVLRKLPFSGNNHSGYKDILENLGKNLGEKSDIAKFLKTGKGEKAARNQIEHLKGYVNLGSALSSTSEKSNPELASTLEHAVEARSLMNKRTLFFDSDNRNLQLATEMSLLSSDILDKDKDAIGNGIKKVALLKMCMSGKDRTGLSLCSDTNAAVAKKIGVNKDQTLSNIIKGGHTQFMASINAGTPGCHGIKKESTTGFSKMFEKINKLSNLYQKTSSHNKIKVRGKPSHEVNEYYIAGQDKMNTTTMIGSTNQEPKGVTASVVRTSSQEINKKNKRFKQDLSREDSQEEVSLRSIAARLRLRMVSSSYGKDGSPSGNNGWIEKIRARMVSSSYGKDGSSRGK